MIIAALITKKKQYLNDPITQLGRQRNHAHHVHIFAAYHMALNGGVHNINESRFLRGFERLCQVDNYVHGKDFVMYYVVNMIHYG